MEQMTALRAEWFTQLADAIDGAQQLAWQLGTRTGGSSEARELYSRLEVARLELDSLRGVWTSQTPGDDPDWLRKLGWNGPPMNPPD